MAQARCRGARRFRPGRKVAPKELCAQAAEAVARIDPQIEAVLGLYEDVVADPDKDSPSKEGRLYGVPMFLKDLGSGLAARKQESGLLTTSVASNAGKKF